ncbi:MAG: N6-L-threonylcarbamoyladenine synthase [Dokdonia sp.]|jgi:N6-L-threonylcarbamoyladenine synthase
MTTNPTNCYLLAIESSCDDTATSIFHNDKMLSNVVATQEIHQQYGRVVPELASKAQQQNIVPVVTTAIRKANIDKKELNAIAFTSGPGLLGSLPVGTSFAKSLALSLNIPLIDANHMQADILTHFINEEGYEKPSFPFLAMTISRGHTHIVRVNNHFQMSVIGESIDDVNVRASIQYTIVGILMDKIKKAEKEKYIDTGVHAQSRLKI